VNDRPLTHTAHQRLLPRLHEGDLAVDATAGNGHDTLFLARRVGVEGHVYAFDIQPQALEETGRRLQEAGMASRVTLLQAGHEEMERRLPAEVRGHLAAVMFNLGYLPGSDKQRVTTASTTLQALEQAVRLLAPGGLLSVLAYRGHPGGREEAEAVGERLSSLPGLAIEVLESPGPVLFLARKRGV